MRKPDPQFVLGGIKMAKLSIETVELKNAAMIAENANAIISEAASLLNAITVHEDVYRT